MSLTARQIALEILNTLDRGRKTLDAILAEYSGPAVFDSKPERALAHALVYGVLRRRGHLDYVIAQFSKTRFDKIDPAVLNILRLALFQIIYLDRIPDSAAVHTAVELAKSAGASWVVGYVNALLRKAAREHKHMSFPGPGQDAIASMALQKSFPEWIIRKWLKRYGRELTASLCDSLNAIPPLTIRTNTLKTSRNQLIDSLRLEVDHIQPTGFSPDGITFDHPAVAIPQLQAFKEGWFQVQDEAAQLVSLLLDPKPGDTVLDACAGLGGKTGHIAQLMNNEGILVALDMSTDKLARLSADSQRLGISIVSTRAHDLEHDWPIDQLAGFDRILLDAPCSGLGVIRRNPDIKWQAAKKNLSSFKTRQIRLLKNIAHLVNPSGILVYAVCSAEPEETDQVIDEFLKNHDEFGISNDWGRLPDNLLPAAGATGVFRTYPHLTQMDGFYSIRLQRLS